MSAGVVVPLCFVVAGLAIALGVLVEWLQERADAKRRARRGGYLDIGPNGRRRLP